MQHNKLVHNKLATHFASMTSKYKKDDEGVQPSSVALCVSVNDYRTFRDDYQRLVDFIHWYNEFK